MALHTHPWVQYGGMRADKTASGSVETGNFLAEAVQKRAHQRVYPQIRIRRVAARARLHSAATKELSVEAEICQLCTRE